MRTFIGIDLPVQVKQNLLILQSELKQLGIKGFWKHQDNFHITLEFLGEVEPGKIAVIENILAKTASNHNKFALKLNGLGAFPSLTRPHTLWTAINGDIKRLYNLQRDIHLELLSHGFSLDKRPFKPHISLASRPEFRSLDLEMYMNKLLAEIAVTDIVLFESRVTGGKRSYPHLFEAKLSD
jgi:2'-5' RNA ligase